MKNVLFAALFGVAAAATAGAQTPPPAPSPAPIPPFNAVQPSPPPLPAPMPGFGVTPAAPAPLSPPVAVFPVARPVPSFNLAQAAAPPAQPAPAAPPPARQATPAPPAGASTVNVRFDVTITDTGGGPKPVTKTVTLTVSPGSSGSIRSTGYGPTDSTAAPLPLQASPTSWLNVDVRVTAFVDNGVRAQVNVEYQPYFPDSKVKVGAITAGSMSIFYDGRKTQLLVASDPISDRRTTIDVTATFLK